MKTIIHLELSDEERNDLAKRIRRDPLTKALVTRTEIKELVFALVQQEMEDGREQDTPCEQEPEKQATSFIPSRGDEPYLTQPIFPDLSAACSSILDNLEMIERHVWTTIERNRK